MNLTISSKINLLIITDFSNDIESETCGKQKINLSCLLEFLSFVSFMRKEVYNKNLTLTFNNNLVSFTILDVNVSWSDIFSFNDVYKEYRDLGEF
tara:strand:- start:297 stop:581 length:285 start_codon:yes stop_codon:yes gene_type:complete